MTDNLVEIIEDPTEATNLPPLDPEKTAEWQRVKGLIIDAQAQLLSFFAKLEEELGNRIKIESVAIDRTERSPVSRYSFTGQSDVAIFEEKHPEAKVIFHNRIDNVTLVISVDKEVS